LTLAAEVTKAVDECEDNNDDYYQEYQSADEERKSRQDSHIEDPPSLFRRYAHRGVRKKSENCALRLHFSFARRHFSVVLRIRFMKCLGYDAPPMITAITKWPCAGCGITVRVETEAPVGSSASVSVICPNCKEEQSVSGVRVLSVTCEKGHITFS